MYVLLSNYGNNWNRSFMSSLYFSLVSRQTLQIFLLSFLSLLWLLRDQKLTWFQVHSYFSNPYRALLRFSADGTRFHLAPVNECRFFSIMHYWYKVPILSSLTSVSISGVHRKSRKFWLYVDGGCQRVRKMRIIFIGSENLNKFRVLIKSNLNGIKIRSKLIQTTHGFKSFNLKFNLKISINCNVI